MLQRSELMVCGHPSFGTPHLMLWGAAWLVDDSRAPKSEGQGGSEPYSPL